MRVRWLIAALLALLSVLNYVDRQALAILATTIQHELAISDERYGLIGSAFLVCYTLAYLASGRIVDRAGPRVAEALFVAWWSVANMLTGLAAGFGSLLGFRCLLGLGEPGHYAVAAKVVGQWFPPREKGLAVGLYTMGGTLGAALAAPLVAWLTEAYGWRAAFAVTGAAGLVLALAWWVVYRPPGEHPWLGPAESAYLRGEGVLDRPRVEPLPLSALVGRRALWTVLAARVLTDPVWYFYLIWFAKYLQAAHGFTLARVGATAWVVFVAADAGCLLAGAFAGRLMRRAVSPLRARLTVAAGAALVASFSWVIPLGGPAWALAWASVCACAVMTFMVSCVALPLDLFPPSSLGSVQGLIGMGGSLGGAASTAAVAAVIGRHGYDGVFYGLSVLHPLAALLLLTLLLGTTDERPDDHADPLRQGVRAVRA